MHGYIVNVTINFPSDRPIIKNKVILEPSNKSLAVVDIGDRLATIDMGRKVGRAAVPLWEGS